MIYLEDGTIVPVDKIELPVVLPDDIDLSSQGNPLESHPNWKMTTQKSTGKKATRETDTLDTFVDSSWYFMRFCSPKYKDGPFDEKKINYWMPVDQYIGGIEHAILHLLYSRFLLKVLINLIKTLTLMNHLKIFLLKEWFAMSLIKILMESGYTQRSERKDTKNVIKRKDKTKVIVGPLSQCQNLKKILLTLKQ